MQTSSNIIRGALKRRGILPLNMDDRPIVWPDPAKWIHENFYLYDSRKRITLYDWQVRPLRKALERDEQGNFKYVTVIWAWPKKSAKSSVIAAVAHYRASHIPNGSIKLIANDLKQADSRVGMYLRESIKLAQKDGLSRGVDMTPSGYKISYPNGAKVEAVPIDPNGEAGGNDDMMVYSELWGWKSKAHQRMWSEMTISPNKFGNAQRWIDTYAGVKGESPILEQLYETGVEKGYKIWPDLEVYENVAARMLTVWVTKPMFPWQTEEYYAEEQGSLTPSEYDRMHRNKWAESTETFISIDWWDACRVDVLPEWGRRGVVMGLDAASKDDCFALVIVSHENEIAHVRHSKIWAPPEGGRISFDEVEKYILELYKRYNIIEVAYDETQLVSMAERLGKGVHWKAFPQGKERLVADKRLYDMIRDNHMMHTGDLDLREHMLNANRKPEDEKLRIVKRNANKKIDAVVACSMATDRAVYYNL